MDIEDFGNMCMGCMQDKGDSEVCPKCGYRMDRRRNPAALPYQAVLNNKFLVGRILGKPGGFGITYLAWDLVLHTTVAIKEYLPLELATRDTNRLTVFPYVEDEESEQGFAYGLKQFLNEARTLGKFSHPNVVRVREFFEQNKTAYLVMDYYEGVSLEEYLKRNGGRLGEAAAMALMAPVLDGLREVHAKGFLHRDIKPSNIYLTKGGTPILLDFGAARLALQGQRSRPLSVILTPGFAPFEQYLEKKEFGPTVDIYAVGATLYYLVTGKVPQPSMARVQKDELAPPDQLSPSLSPRLSRAIMNAMAIEAEQRPQTVDELRALLSAEGPVAAAPPPPNRAGVRLPPASFPVACPRCAAGNPVPTGADPYHFFCAKCGSRLAGPARRRWPSPAWVWALLGASALAAGLAWRGGQPAGPALPQDPPPQEAPRQDSPDAAGPAEGEDFPQQEAPRQGGPGPGARAGGRLPPYPPPQNAIDACHGQPPGAACDLPNRVGGGVCRQVHDYFACVPDGLPPPP